MVNQSSIVPPNVISHPNPGNMQGCTAEKLLTSRTISNSICNQNFKQQGFLKARRIYKFYYAFESRTAYPNLWRVANLIHVLLLLAHWFGCFYYMLSELEGFKGNWAYKHPESQEHSSLVRKYLGSVYWSTLTLTTIGDLATPATNLQ
ncbi:Cyclic nucleotide-gated channel rod photoreceptor subunit alpha [Araneus ventricosus]|uniref:Cyclic nucleotide-gated channel rod photoreceptor subunit alpha n=1 Tax=Araneus ventricosus TaxID=182803 RepID=A0A4Y2BSE2_ARAVE|nr:Cyclic nucleotide-gated channel rod photoreceptor subunit alpha [Araneus ventricosus]